MTGESSPPGQPGPLSAGAAFSQAHGLELNRALNRSIGRCWLG